MRVMAARRSSSRCATCPRARFAGSAEPRSPDHRHRRARARRRCEGHCRARSAPARRRAHAASARTPRARRRCSARPPPPRRRQRAPMVGLRVRVPARAVKLATASASVSALIRCASSEAIRDAPVLAAVWRPFEQDSLSNRACGFPEPGPLPGAPALTGKGLIPSDEAQRATSEASPVRGYPFFRVTTHHALQDSAKPARHAASSWRWSSVLQAVPRTSGRPGRRSDRAPRGLARPSRRCRIR